MYHEGPRQSFGALARWRNERLSTQLTYFQKGVFAPFDPPGSTFFSRLGRPPIGVIQKCEDG